MKNIYAYLRSISNALYVEETNAELSVKKVSVTHRVANF